MKQAGPGNKWQLIVVFILVTGLSGSLLTWRESAHRSRFRTSQDALQNNRDALAEVRRELTDARDAAASLEQTLSELRIENQSMKDRISNLEAQRDHLKADNQNKLQQVSNLQQAIETITNDLAEARHRTLLLESLPEKLSLQLESARRRVEELETALDDQSVQFSAAPAVFGIAGVSSDQQVFALEGDWDNTTALPAPVYLCNLHGILLEGWIHRLDAGNIIGHTGILRQAASALVKGEKVFILPRENHEQRD